MRLLVCIFIALDFANASEEVCSADSGESCQADNFVMPSYVHSTGPYRDGSQPVNFHNLFSETLTAYWVQVGTGKELESLVIPPNSVRNTQSYVGHTFIFRNKDGVERARHTVEPMGQDNFFGPNCDSKCQKLKKHIEYKKEYYKRTGKAYMVNYVRDPTQMFMYDTNYLGQVHTVNTDFGFCTDSTCSTDNGALTYGLTVIKQSPRILIVENVTNAFEREHFLTIAKQRFHFSGVGDGRVKKHYSRSSKTAWIGHKEDPITTQVSNRIMNILNLPLATLKQTEQYQFVEYQKGTNYSPHFDMSFPNPRFITFGMYFKNSEGGGRTIFPKAEIEVKPPEGAAVIWYNLLPDGNGDEMALHGGTVVTRGEKFFCNVWIHEKH